MAARAGPVRWYIREDERRRLADCALAERLVRPEQQIAFDTRELADLHPEASDRVRAASVGLGLDPLEQRLNDRVLVHRSSLAKLGRPFAKESADALGEVATIGASHELGELAVEVVVEAFDAGSFVHETLGCGIRTGWPSR